jgi:hypothetical protein
MLYLIKNWSKDNCKLDALLRVRADSGNFQAALNRFKLAGWEGLPLALSKG